MSCSFEMSMKIFIHSGPVRPTETGHPFSLFRVFASVIKRKLCLYLFDNVREVSRTAGSGWNVSSC